MILSYYREKHKFDHHPEIKHAVETHAYMMPFYKTSCFPCFGTIPPKQNQVQERTCGVRDEKNISVPYRFYSCFFARIESAKGTYPVHRG
jgi:hypothetical protein